MSKKITRRSFLKRSALGLGAAAGAVSVGGQTPTNSNSASNNQAYAAADDYTPEYPLSGIKNGKLTDLPASPSYQEQVIELAKASTEDITNLEDAAYTDYVELAAEFAIDRPAVLFSHSSGKTMALVQSESIRIMNEVWEVNATGHTVLLGRAIGHMEGYHIGKVLGNVTSLIWVELNYGSGNWRLYTSLYSELNNQAPILIDQGSVDFDVPQMDLVGQTLIWTKVPSLTGPNDVEASVIKRYTPQTDVEPQVIWQSPGRILGGVTASNDCICFISRIREDTVSYQLVAIDVLAQVVVSKLVLPASLRPDHAWFNAQDATFSFSTTDTIIDLPIFGNPASYIQSKSNYSHFYIIKKLPSQIPLQMGEWLYIKGNKSVVGYNIAEQKRIIIPNLDYETANGDMLSCRGAAAQLTIYCIVPTFVNGKSFHDFETVKRGLVRGDDGLLTSSQHTVVRIFK